MPRVHQAALSPICEFAFCAACARGMNTRCADAVSQWRLQSFVGDPAAAWASVQPLTCANMTVILNWFKLPHSFVHYLSQAAISKLNNQYEDAT